MRMAHRPLANMATTPLSRCAAAALSSASARGLPAAAGSARSRSFLSPSADMPSARKEIWKTQLCRHSERTNTNWVTENRIPRFRRMDSFDEQDIAPPRIPDGTPPICITSLALCTFAHDSFLLFFLFLFSAISEAAQGPTDLSRDKPAPFTRNCEEEGGSG